MGDQIHATGDEFVGRVEQVTGALAPLAETMGSATQAVAGFPADIQQARRGISALADAAQVVAGSLDGKAGDVARASETLTRNARQQQEIMEQNLERARAIGARMDSEVSEWSQSEERIRAALGVAGEMAGALGTLVEQVESASRTLAEFSGRLEAARALMDARNGALEAAVSPSNGGTSWSTVFRDELRRQLARAEMEGKPHIAVSAESLHRQLGDCPDAGERMRECCEVMYGEMGNDDRVDTPPHDGPGATLTIRYVLPRPVVA